MSSFFWKGRCIIQLAARLDQIQGIDQLSALVTLISSSILIATERTGSLDEAISEETAMLLAIWLECSSLFQVTIVPKSEKNILSNNGLLFGRSLTKIVEIDVEPFVGLNV